MDFKRKASTLGRVRGQAPGPTKGTEAGGILIPENKSRGTTGGSTVREEAVRIWAIIARSSTEVSINLLLQQEGVANTHFTWAIQEGSATSSTAHTTNRHAMHMGKQKLMQQESMIHAQCPLSLSANGDNSPWTHQGVPNSTASINDQAIAHHIVQAAMPPRRAPIGGEEGKTKSTEERFQGNTALTSVKGKINIEIPQKDERMSPPRKRRQVSFQGGQSSHKVIHGATAVWQAPQRQHKASERRREAE